MPKSLRDRFQEFITKLPYSEVIDELETPKIFIDEKRADYFIENRKVIIEQKTLESDPEYKVHEELDKHRERDEFPLIYGEVELSKILKHLPDGDSINGKLFYKVSRSIEKSFRSADKQIKSTKEIFNCSNSSGLLVLLNENIDVLSTEIISYRISELLAKLDDSGNLRYPHITSVWLIFENYTYKSKPGHTLLPSIIVDGPNYEKYKDLDIIYFNLQKEWAAFNGIPFITKNIKKIRDAKFARSHLRDENKKFLSQHDIWRKQYRHDPYLRVLSEEVILEHGARLLELMKPHFIKSGKKYPAEIMQQFMEGWTHFLEECEIRGIDLKKMPLRKHRL